ncbi:MAG: zinc metalloprotease HtpX [Pseudomonadota bacterium]
MNIFKTSILLASLTALLVFSGGALGGQTGIIIALAFALFMNVGSYWFSDKIVLKMHNAQEVNSQTAPDFYYLVQGLAKRAGLPMPKVYLIDDDTPNAFATGRNPEHAAVAATTGIMRILSHDELAGVMAHELAHVRHRDTLISTVSATIAGAISGLASMAQWAMIFGMGRNNDSRGGGLVTIIMMMLAPLAASLIQMAISRSREYAADKAGAEISGKPLGLANALRKMQNINQQYPMQNAEVHTATAHLFIINPLSGKNIGRLFSTHPDTNERIRRLEAMA